MVVVMECVCVCVGGGGGGYGKAFVLVSYSSSVQLLVSAAFIASVKVSAAAEYVLKEIIIFINVWTG